MRLPRLIPRVLLLLAAMVSVLLVAESCHRQSVYRRLADYHALESSRYARLARSSRQAAQTLESFDAAEAAKRSDQLASLQAALPGELAEREEIRPALSQVRADLTARLDVLTSQRRAEVQNWLTQSSQYERLASHHARLKRYYERRWW